MNKIIYNNIHKGKSVKAWKDPGFYTIDFLPASIRIPEDNIKGVIWDLSQIIKKIKVIR